jgi:DNA invertase Pin-like site-specific DNA recombinase
MSIIGYARVSTKDQSLEAQLELLKASGCIKIFHGTQSGKSKNNIDKLDELIDYVREDDVVMLTKLDRMGRSLNQILSTIQKLHEKGVRVKTLDGQVDTQSENPMQKAMTQLLGVFAELEHSIIVDRLQSGRQRTGKLGGRTKTDKSIIGAVLKRRQLGESKSALSKEFCISRAVIGNWEKESGEQYV